MRYREANILFHRRAKLLKKLFPFNLTKIGIAKKDEYHQSFSLAQKRSFVSLPEIQSTSIAQRIFFTSFPKIDYENVAKSITGRILQHSK